MIRSRFHVFDVCVYSGFTALSLAILPTQSLNVIQPPNLHETCFGIFVGSKNYMSLYLGQEFLEVKMVKRDFDYEDELKYAYNLLYLISIYILRN